MSSRRPYSRITITADNGFPELVVRSIETGEETFRVRVRDAVEVCTDEGEPVGTCDVSALQAEDGHARDRAVAQGRASCRAGERDPPRGPALSRRRVGNAADAAHPG